jgi:eukaryotic-like serine/threonine-protein kinase
MSLAPGFRLGPYEILGALGAGGMGEVYRARDSRLDRDVAIKILPELFATDPDRLMRFEREAKTLATLNHSGIAQIYGIEEAAAAGAGQAAPRALVMELVEGEDLSKVIARGPVPLEQALPIARQIAEALEAAHDAGIVHRDLKPANIKVRPDGTVKVLDFGLAKTPAPAASGSGPLANSPTFTSPAFAQAPAGQALTQMGVILGTVAYMAPEQARGRPVDKRVDVWAFGCVLFEMLAGRSAFGGETVTDTLAAIMTRPPDLAQLPPGTPRGIRRLLERCLERDPGRRLRDIGEARIALEADALGPDQVPAGPVASSRGRMAAWLAASLAIAALAALAGWLWRAPAGEASPRMVHFEVQPPAGSSITRGLAVSPDGRHIAFVARRPDGRASLWLRAIDASELRELPDTLDARYPFWAPDSRRLGFFSRRSLMWIDVAGGAPEVIAPTLAAEDVRGAAWGAGDHIVFSPGYTGPLMKVALAGGAVTPAVTLPDTGEIGTARFPSFLPDGHRFVFYVSPGTGTEPGALYLGRLDTLAMTRLGPAHSAAVYAAPGYLLYARGEGLVAHRFDERQEVLVGEPIPLGIPMGGSLSVSGLRTLGVSRDGLLAYRSDKRNLNQIIWVDREGRELAPVTEAGSVWHYAPRLSPDRRLLAVSQYSLRGGSGELWLQDVARGVNMRITSGDGDDYGALWIGPRELLYFSDRPGGASGIYRVHLDRPGEREPWLLGPTLQVPISAAPGGRVLIERLEGALWLREGMADPVRLSEPGTTELSAEVAPNGQWFAYMSDVTGTWEVFIRRLEPGSPPVRVSAGGGTQPLWRPDGRELYYLDGAGRVTAIPVTWTLDEVALGAPAPLFDGRVEGDSRRQYDISADGSRFLLNRSPTLDTLPIAIVLDWRALLDRPAAPR